jgi:phage shock protein A
LSCKCCAISAATEKLEQVKRQRQELEQKREQGKELLAQMKARLQAEKSSSALKMTRKMGKVGLMEQFAELAGPVSFSLTSSEP